MGGRPKAVLPMTLDHVVVTSQGSNTPNAVEKEAHEAEEDGMEDCMPPPGSGKPATSK